MAVKQINDAGGFQVNSVTYKLALDVEDGQSTPTAAVAAATTITQDKGIKFLPAYIGTAGVLTGSSRVAQEARERADAVARDVESERTGADYQCQFHGT